MSDIIYSTTLGADLRNLLSQLSYDKLFIFTDENVKHLVFPLLSEYLEPFAPQTFTMQPGERNKNLETLSKLWQFLSENGATRNSLLLNVGGGVVTDLGGFAAATFKRGIRFINIPTSLLGAVDAAVGGKTGLDFNGLKNEIGAFANSAAVLISTEPLQSLPQHEIISGFAEIVKMTMIRSKQQYTNIMTSETFPELMPLIRFAVEEKKNVVAEDPREGGLRKILNFGHTAGHAFESLAIEKGKPIAHGVAVAHGILVALILSNMLLKLDSNNIHIYKNEILRRYFPAIGIECKDTDHVMELISHDKKRSGNATTFILLSEIGNPVIQNVADKDVRAAIDAYLDILES